MTELCGTVWVVVKVWRGLADFAEAYQDKETAWERVRQLRPTVPDHDDLDVFEVVVGQRVPESEL